MKIFGLSFLTITSLLSVSPVFANMMPPDLEDLRTQWSRSAILDDTETLMSLEYARFDADEDVYKIVKNSFEASPGGMVKRITQLQFTNLKEDSRAKILGALFPKGDKSLAFCSALEEPTTKVSKKCSPEEQAVKYEKAKFKNCKEKVNELLSGIFHSNPDVQFGDVRYEDGSSEVVFLVTSTVDTQSHLKYKFKR